MLAVHLLPERQCATCTVAQQRSWGCDTQSKPARLPVTLGGEVQTRCPRIPLKNDKEGAFASAFESYRSHKLGFLPEPGGLLDQPYVEMEMVKIIGSAVREVEAHWEQERAARAAKGSGGRG